MKNKCLLLLILLSLSGCCKKESLIQPVYPPFPLPSEHVIDQISGLKDNQVDNWMIKLFQLKEQLEVSKTK